MTDFVHLHLHTEFSLLDGACRIDELLDEAVKLKMPALAVTEHGNMFSSVVFHDHARARGIKPILGCEVYVAQGSRFEKSGPQTETNHLVLLAETNEGYKNLIKLVSAGYTEGFYYRPRIDKDLLAQHAKGLIGLSSCLKGEVASALKVEQARPALEAAARLRDILGPRNFFLEMQYQGIEEQKVVNKGILPLARELNLPLVATNDVHYLRQGDSQPHDILLCIGTGKTVNDAQRLRYTGDQFFLKTAEQMQAVFRDHPDALSNTARIAERCDVLIPEDVNHLPVFDVPPGSTPDEYFEQVVRDGFEKRLVRLRQLAGEGRLRHTLDEYERRLEYRDRDGEADGVWRLLPDRLGLHPLRARAVDSRRSGPRIGGGLARGLVHAHHRRGPARLRSHLRALPEPGARVAARHRRGLLRAPARGSDRVRDAQVRPGERGADHHVRDHEGQGRRARRGPRARHALRRRGPHRQADPGGARHDARQGAGREPGAQGDGGEGPQGQGGPRRRRAGWRGCRATPRCTPPAW